jgi:hypothetical protein
MMHIMSYEIVLAQQPAIETGTLTLHLDKKIEIVVSGQEARRRVNNWAHLELSSQMRATQPQLVITAQGATHWRVPLHLTFSALGDIGPVGVVLVDVQTGNMNPAIDLDRLNLLGQLFTHLEAVDEAELKTAVAVGEEQFAQGDYKTIEEAEATLEAAWKGLETTS